MKKALMFVALLALVGGGAIGASALFADGDDAALDARSHAEAANSATQIATDSGKPHVKRDAEGLLYIIFDSSNSMWGELPDKSRKYEAARTAMRRLLETDVRRQSIAFRAYGHRRAGDCGDIELIVPPAAPGKAGPQIISAMDAMRPTGKTPITGSLNAALSDIGDDQADILLISDGIETCDLDPCSLMNQWQDRGIAIRVHVVGVGLNDVERAAMSCVAETSGGQYFDAGSEEEFTEALNRVGNTVIAEPEPANDELGYSLAISGTDETGRAFVLKGSLLQDGETVAPLTSTARNPVAEPGTYQMRVGVELADGTIYKPVSQTVTIAQPGVTELALNVTRPAIVAANFSENGETHRGDFVRAFQDGEEVFGFRAFDEALARPGTYSFRSNPNQDNELTVEASLTEGDRTIVDFDVTPTVAFTIRFRQSDGTIINRNSTLSRNGEPIYSVNSRNGGRAVAGTYQLTMDDPQAPLTTPVSVTIRSERQDIIIDLPEAQLTISYTGPEGTFRRRPNRAFAERWDAERERWGRRTFTRINEAVSFAPGRYRITGWRQAGDFEPQIITLRAGEERSVAIANR